MAQALLYQNRAEFVDIAAFLVGAVLENGLRRIARNHEVTLRESEDISSLNHKLADAKIYNDLWRQKIQLWNKLRGNADHARFGRNSSSDISHMLAGVRDFLIDFLASYAGRM
ncbi:MAG: hypothetical protein JO356_07895 [Acidobacteria bacterium]|nr:hypothetical protein [Acidobacteriota bacterium]